MQLDHLLFLAAAVCTHVLVGFALARAATVPAAVGALGGLLPDVDLLFAGRFEFPLVHRGLLHTPAFLAAAALVAALLADDRRAGAALALGGASHLALDSLTESGVMWLYPAVDRSFGVAAGVHAPLPTLALWALSAALVAAGRRRARGRSGETA